MFIAFISLAPCKLLPSPDPSLNILAGDMSIFRFVGSDTCFALFVGFGGLANIGLSVGALNALRFYHLNQEKEKLYFEGIRYFKSER